MPKFRRPGHTQIPNEVFDDIMKILTGAQFKVLCLVARKTLGYHRDCHSISLNQIAEGCGISQQGAMDALKFLAEGDYVMKHQNPVPGADRQFNPSTYSLSIEDDGSQEFVPNDLGAPSQTSGEYRPNPIGSPLRDKEVLKEKGEIKEITPSGPIFEIHETKTQPPDTPPAPTLDRDQVTPGGAIDFRTGEPIPQPPKRKTRFKPGKSKPERPYALSDRMQADREAKYNGALSGVGSIATPWQVSKTPPMPPAASNGQVRDFPARWNVAIPEQPVDPTLLAQNPQSYREPVFAQRFEEICQKAKELIAAGADLTFGFLLSKDKNTEQYRWQQLLAGQLGWLKPRASAKSRTPAADTKRWIADMEQKLKEGKPL